MIPFRRLRPLVAIVTSFTVAHSITLIASARDLGPDALWFPPLIETLIAVSIVYMALENIVGSNVGRRWIITFAFGLVHGFGFSFALRQTLQFVKLGFTHILDGTDHLLFLFCLVIPFRRFRALFAVVTAFTVAHSITLFASAYDFAPDALWFPPLIETLIATSIVYMALENIVGASREGAERAQPTPRTSVIGGSASAAFKRRWVVAFAFGLVHGFGFSFALRQTLQFAGSHLLASLLSFNIGVELGQLLVLVTLVPALDALFTRVVAERTGTIVLSALVAHTAWHWMTDRAAILRQFRFEWPTLDVIFLASAMRWMMLAVVAAGLYWLVFHVLKAQRETSAPELGRVEPKES